MLGGGGVNLDVVTCHETNGVYVAGGRGKVSWTQYLPSTAEGPGIQTKGSGGMGTHNQCGMQAWSYKEKTKKKEKKRKKPQLILSYTCCRQMSVQCKEGGS